MRPPVLLLAAGLLLSAGPLKPAGVFAQAGDEGRLTYSRPLMGTTFRILVAASPGSEIDVAVEQAFDRIAHLERILSDYDPDSEISRIAAAGGGCESADLRVMLRHAADYHQRTGGAFDAALGNLTRLWRRAVRRGTRPTGEEVEEARAQSGWHLVDLSGDCLALRSGVRLDFGGIAKGFAADEALAVMEAAGFPVVLIDAGGDLRAGAAPPGGWEVELPGGDRLLLEHAAMATSGDSYRHLEDASGRYSHIVDPSSGLGVTGGRTVTVLAATGTQADALASALSVLDPTSAWRLAETERVTVYIREPDRSLQIIDPDS